jgi:hypothetical protein
MNMEECFSKITGDFLVFVLSYTYLSDTNAIMRTCRAWYNTTQKQAFWKRRIDQKAPPLFNVFHSLLPETVRHQVEWLFREDWMIVYCGSYCRKSFDGTWLRQYGKKGKLWRVTSYRSSSHVFRFVGKFIQFTFVTDDETDCKYSKILLDFNVFESNICNGTFWCRNGDLYVGESHLFGAKYIPHGDGKWIFSDGTILEGEGIAWKGNPRYIEPPTKRIKSDGTM